MAHKSGQAEIGFIIFALFYLAFVTFAAAQWPGASGTVTGSLSIPTLPAQPGLLDYLIWAIQAAWFYLASFLSFNVGVPWLGIISLVITSAMIYSIISVIRGR
jgi:hypothetical protein